MPVSSNVMSISRPSVGSVSSANAVCGMVSAEHNIDAEITPLKTFFSVLFIVSLSLRVFFNYIIIPKKIGGVNNIRR